MGLHNACDPNQVKQMAKVFTAPGEKIGILLPDLRLIMNVAKILTYKLQEG